MKLKTEKLEKSSQLGRPAAGLLPNRSLTEKSCGAESLAAGTRKFAVSRAAEGTPRVDTVLFVIVSKSRKVLARKRVSNGVGEARRYRRGGSRLRRGRRSCILDRGHRDCLQSHNLNASPAQGTETVFHILSTSISYHPFQVSPEL